MTFIVVIITWLLLSFAVAYGAKNRGRSFGTYLTLSILFSPLIAGIELLMLGENKQGIENNSITEGDSKECPFCAEIIKKEAIVCRYCGRDLPKENIQKDIKTTEQNFESKRRI
ncbi:MAG: zinc ribbon domain-containing protein [Treponema sp.]|uniref:zinc ribbon domain-containing protein n=1 Tax=Treponema sp. TaxID=166 RepID=UPI001D70F368|nr:zinc ribbon domain-containing protein [Treponema sp.]MBS7311609.1 zinc ribbon domain-containing protein [Treponema sp.]MDD5811779.1 zinc ribbon domain-containing protein [Treponema sp.]